MNHPQFCLPAVVVFMLKASKFQENEITTKPRKPIYSYNASRQARKVGLTSGGVVTGVYCLRNQNTPAAVSAKKAHIDL
jgi:lysozyme family protein